MRMSELIVIKLLINVKFIDDYSVKISINLLYNRTMHDNKYNFMYNIIFVSITLLVGSRLNVSQTKKVIRPTALFSDSEHFFVQLLSQPLAS